MPLIKWTPSFFDQFDQFDQFFKELAPLSNMPLGLYPALDIYQDDKNVYVEAQLAGVDPDNVELGIDNDILTLEGRVERKTEVDEKNYYRKEIKSGSFHRAVALPAAVQSDKAKAIYENGVLKITIPKEIKDKIKPIKIKVAKKK